MRTITTLILVFSISFLKAQYNPATPNAGLEHWTHFTSYGGYDDPDSMNCLNPTLMPLGYVSCIKDSANPHSGKYDAQLVTENVFGFQVAPAALTTGTINTTNKTINGGLPYTLRPDSMVGWYHYLSVSGDNGDCEFYLFGATHADTIGQAFFKTPTSTVNNWTRFALPIKYGSFATPDTALWIFSSSLSNTSAQTGSQLFIDDLGLVFKDSTSGVKDINKYDNISIYPNPTNGPVSISNGSGSGSLTFFLLDVTGRKIDEERMVTGMNNLDLTGLAAGIYMYSIQDGQASVLKTGKIIIQK
jgi:Secretion system C-terminal sorting domain